MVRPRKISDVKPQYTPLARSTRIEGRVVLLAVIDTDGRIRNVRALQGLPGLTAEAIKAVRQWRYEPATLNGTPVPVFFNLTINFTLQR